MRKPFTGSLLTRAEREGKRPNEVCARLKFDDDYGYWVWIKEDGRRYRATDLPAWWNNDARYSYDRRPGEPKEDPSYEPYPLPLLAKALRCSHTDVLEIIGRYGEFYRKRK